MALNILPKIGNYPIHEISLEGNDPNNSIIEFGWPLICVHNLHDEEGKAVNVIDGKYVEESTNKLVYFKVSRIEYTIILIDVLLT